MQDGLTFSIFKIGEKRVEDTDSWELEKSTVSFLNGYTEVSFPIHIN